MKNTFSRAATQDNTFTRRWGSLKTTIDPYITGYAFVHFAYLPEYLGKVISSTSGGQALTDISTTSIKNLLASTCLSVNIPGASLSKAEFNGLGNVRWAVPSGVDWDNNCSMRFIESSGLPIHGIFHGWIRMIRDYSTGVSILSGESGTQQYTKSNYSAVAYYWTTEPNGLNVEYHSCLTGLFPMRDPTDQFSHDITSNDRLEIDMDFNVDYLWHEDWTYNYCKTKASDYHSKGWGGLNGSGVVPSYGREDGDAVSSIRPNV